MPSSISPGWFRLLVCLLSFHESESVPGISFNFAFALLVGVFPSVYIYIFNLIHIMVSSFVGWFHTICGLLFFWGGEGYDFLRRQWFRWTCNRPKFKRRRALPYHLVLRCRRRKFLKPPVWFADALAYVEECCEPPLPSSENCVPKEAAANSFDMFLSNYAQCPQVLPFISTAERPHDWSTPR